MQATSWENHYTDGKSELLYPDENLARLLKKNRLLRSPGELTAVDLGCGSGRHIKLLSEMGVKNIVGLDASYNALVVSRKQCPGPMLQGDNLHLPLKDGSTDIVVAWGSLHYNGKPDLGVMIDEIRRVLKNGGCLFATLRCERDTYLKRGERIGDDTWITDLNDISGSTASFYSEDELKRYFSVFNEFTYGLMERTIMGDMSALISHWVIEARR